VIERGNQVGNSSVKNLYAHDGKPSAPSINKNLSWYRTHWCLLKTLSIYRCGGSVGFAPTSHIADQESQTKIHCRSI